MPHLDIICLANSLKHGGRCVAGLRLDGRGWLRPVSNKDDGTLLYYHYRYADSSLVQHLDVVRVSLIRPKPLPFQPENWLIDGKPWTLVARPPTTDQLAILRSALCAGPELLIGTKDRATPEEIASATTPRSLELIAPTTLTIYPLPRRDDTSRARVKFELGLGEQAITYELALTDLHWRAEAHRRGRFQITQAEMPFVVTVSFSEPWEGHCHKLAAAIILLPGAAPT